MYYKKPYTIALSDIDFKKQLKLSKLFEFLQDTSSDASEQLGLGINTLEQEFKVAWVLIRIRVDCLRIPNWNETITIKTWPISPKTLEFERDFLVYDEQGEVIIKAVTSWVIIDLESRKIKKTSLINPVYPQEIHTRAISCTLGKFKAVGPLVENYKKVIGYSDIDLNGHLNNSRYIDYMMDCFSMDAHQKASVQSIEVSFLNEAMPGDTLTLLTDLSQLDEQIIIIEGFNETSKKAVFKAKVEISKSI
jgi:medium-chain acyl-[acyl-carrier-protein] hydrolase